MLTASWNSCFTTASSQPWAAANREREPGPNPEQGRDRAKLSPSPSCPSHSPVGNWGESQTPQPQLTPKEPCISWEGCYSHLTTPGAMNLLPPFSSSSWSSSSSSSSSSPFIPSGRSQALIFPPGLTHCCPPACSCLGSPGWAGTAVAVADCPQTLPGCRVLAIGSPQTLI